MLIDFVPSVPVALALGSCALLPLALLVLSHWPLKVTALGRRFALAALAMWTAWIAGMIACVPDVVDAVTGCLLLATATLAGFTLWTLIAWGFTLSMLLTLHRAGQPLKTDEWVAAYTRGKRLDAFALDRLGVLFKLGLAEMRDGKVVMTPGRGLLFARVAVLLRKLFGIRS
jgi:hypothetical protein